LWIGKSGAPNALTGEEGWLRCKPGGPRRYG
jgi:hypothetical protein